MWREIASSGDPNTIYTFVVNAFRLNVTRVCDQLIPLRYIYIDLYIHICNRIALYMHKKGRRKKLIQYVVLSF